MSVMTPTEVCERLGIQPSTLRKYSLLFEKEQIIYARNKNKSRVYTVTQVEAMEQAVTLAHSSDTTLENAVRQAAEQLKNQSVITPEQGITPVAPQRHNDDITTVMLEEIRSLKEEIRERDLLFVEALEKMQQKLDSMEQRQLNGPTPAETEINTAESQPQQEPVKKKGFFARLFK